MAPAPSLPILPLRDVHVFPTVALPLLLGRAGSVAALESALRSERPEKLVLLVAQRDPLEADVPAEGLCPVGVVARVEHVSRLPDGTVKAVVHGLRRARVRRVQAIPGQPAGAFVAEAVPMPLLSGSAPAEATDVHAAARVVAERFEGWAALSRRVPPEALTAVREAPGIDRQAWGMASHLPLPHGDRQALLEAADATTLFERLATLVERELELARLGQAIDERAREAVGRNQREFWLHEQLKAIHRELGHGGAEDDDVASLEAQIEAARLPEAARERARHEARRLRRMAPVSPEATVARTYLDWILALPWHEHSADPARAVQLSAMRDTLDRAHHGLREVKDRILDQLAVAALARAEGRTGATRMPILCLVGPPGVGKTSLGRSIADATGRAFARVALGGVRDEGEIRGHRRTYVGALPGRILQAMRKARAIDPVLLLDEVDKLASDWRGDPASALLEVLDPEQNARFSDHFLELEYDLSQVLFVTTANTLATVPEPLRDRMEVVRIPGYLEPEKVRIAERFLVPRQLRECALDAEAVEWPEAVTTAILRGWTREAGVRELERRIGRVALKLARQRAEAREAAEAARAAAGPGERRKRARLPRLVVRPADLPALLGPPPFETDAATLDDKVGVCNGLAYTAAGGELLEVEVSVVPGRGRLQLTGTLGDVMKESAGTAMSWVRARAEALGIDPDFHRTRDVHVHIPAGATPKDGPSAGVTIATALVSALTGRAVRGDVAMTGELTLRGRVLAIGGLKEKGVAAHRHRMREVLVPRQNARALVELPEEVRAAITWHEVGTMDDVLAVALRPAADGVAPLAAGTRLGRPAKGKAARRPRAAVAARAARARSGGDA